MSNFTIYHNPRCSKSRATLALLEAHGVKPDIVEYLKNPPTSAELKAIIQKLGISPQDLVRKGEDVYREKYAGKTLTDAQWLAAMARDPVLIERPIVVTDKGVRLCRPAETVLEILP